MKAEIEDGIQRHNNPAKKKNHKKEIVINRMNQSNRRWINRVPGLSWSFYQFLESSKWKKYYD